MDRNTFQRIVAPTLFFGIFLAGCDSATNPPTAGRLSMSSAYTTAQMAPGGASMLRTQGPTAVDSLQITRARFVLRDVKFKTTADSMNFKAAPFIVDLVLNGSLQTIGVSDVPFATYEKIEFDVHRVEQPEIAALPAAEQSAFVEFLAGERYSIIIDGVVYKNGLAGQSFTYRSKVDAKQKYDLVPPLSVDAATSTANVTLQIGSWTWFRTVGGALVDPTDPNSEGVIDENLKAAIKVYKDNNKDGTKD